VTARRRKRVRLPASVSGRQDASSTPHGKRATQVLRTWFARLAGAAPAGSGLDRLLPQR